jgi:hypothetical protein
MTKQGKKDARIQNRDEAEQKITFINLTAHAGGISLLVSSGLTMFLAWRSQYLAALSGACLTLAAATCNRLRKMQIGLQGFSCEWTDTLRVKSSKGTPVNHKG